jgi:hypothetical protein
MRLESKVKIGNINTLKGKEEFTVSDLIKVLSTLDGNATINFGVKLTENRYTFCQDDNFIFRLEEGEWEGEYSVDIITDATKDKLITKNN